MAFSTYWEIWFVSWKIYIYIRNWDRKKRRTTKLENCLGELTFLADTYSVYFCCCSIFNRASETVLTVGVWFCKMITSLKVQVQKLSIIFYKHKPVKSVIRVWISSVLKQRIKKTGLQEYLWVIIYICYAYF